MNTLESRVADLEALVKEIREKTVRDVIDAVQITKERVFRAEIGQLRKELADVLSAHISGEAERVFAKLSSSLDTQAVDLHGTHVKNVESLHEEHIPAVKSAAELLHDEQARILAQKCEELERNNAAFKDLHISGEAERVFANTRYAYRVKHTKGPHVRYEIYSEPSPSVLDNRIEKYECVASAQGQTYEEAKRNLRAQYDHHGRKR